MSSPRMVPGSEGTGGGPAVGAQMPYGGGTRSEGGSLVGMFRVVGCAVVDCVSVVTAVLKAATSKLLASWVIWALVRLLICACKSLICACWLGLWVAVCESQFTRVCRAAWKVATSVVESVWA